MSAFNKRLAPARVAGFPLPAVGSGLVAVSGALLAVIAPAPVCWLPALGAGCALPILIATLVIGDDVVFLPMMGEARRDRRLAERERLWV